MYTDVSAVVAQIRAAYGPDEHRALAAYRDAHDALERAGLHPYVETRGGLAICAYTDDGTVFVVACEDALPVDRTALVGWHLAHVPEDEPAPAWRCVVYDTVPALPDPMEPGDVRVEPLLEAAMAHLAACAHSPKGVTQRGMPDRGAAS